MLEAYFDIFTLIKSALGRKNPGKFNRERGNQNPKSAQIFRRKVITLQQWVIQ